MRSLNLTIACVIIIGLLMGAAGCQQQTTEKPAMAGKCPPGCKCPKCTKKTGAPSDKAFTCPRAKAAHCDKAGKPECKPAACPSAKICFLDKVNGPKGEGWIALFDGKDLTGWQSMTPDRPMSWKVVDGVMVNEKPHGVNIYTDQKFQDFEFYAEYKIPAGGNSGVFLRGLYEIQIIDDYGVPVDQPKDSGNGGLWSLKAPCKNVSKPAGQWQSIYAKLVGDTVTVILNGQKVIDNFKLERPTHVYDELKQLKPGEPGPILLQGDHKPAEYRNVYIRPIKD
jgi:hypothetical protein